MRAKQERYRVLWEDTIGDFDLMCGRYGKGFLRKGLFGSV